MGLLDYDFAIQRSYQGRPEYCPSVSFRLDFNRICETNETRLSLYLMLTQMDRQTMKRAEI